MTTRSFFTLIGTIGTAALLTACQDNSVTTIDTGELLQRLGDPAYVFVDTRDDSLYNGFKDKHAARGGHLPGAVQFSCAWLDNIAADKFEHFAAGKGITKDKTLVLYDSNPENLTCVSAELAAKGYKVREFKDFISYANANADYPLESFPNFQYSVSPQWVNAVLHGEKPETYDNDKFMLFEVSWGSLEHTKGYTQHIVGAYHFDTDWIENAPLWNLSEPHIIEKKPAAKRHHQRQNRDFVFR